MGAPAVGSSNPADAAAAAAAAQQAAEAAQRAAEERRREEEARRRAEEAKRRAEAAKKAAEAAKKQADQARKAREDAEKKQKQEAAAALKAKPAQRPALEAKANQQTAKLNVLRQREQVAAQRSTAAHAVAQNAARQAQAAKSELSAETKRSQGVQKQATQAAHHAKDVFEAAHKPAPRKAAADPVGGVKSANKAYQNAKSKAATMDGQLAQELNKLGPALTPQQQRQYVSAFRDAHRDVYGAQASAEDKLAKAVTDPGLKAAVIADPRQASGVYDAVKALAGSNRSLAALDWASHTLSDPRASQAFQKQASNVDNDVLSPALMRAPIEAFANNRGSVQQTIQDLQQHVGALLAIKTVAKAPKDLTGGLESMKSAFRGEFSQLDNLALKTPLQRGFAAGNLVIGALMGGASGANEQLAQAARTLLGTGKTGANTVAGAAQALADAGRATETAKKVASFAAKLAPGLGVAASSLALALDSKALSADPNVGRALQVAGDGASVVGSGIESIPLPHTIAIGGIVNVLGGLASAVGGLINNHIQAGKQSAEEDQLLQKIGLGSQLSKTLSSRDSHPEILKSVGMDPLQIQDFARTLPNEYTDPKALQQMADTGKALRLGGQRFADFVHQMRQEQPHMRSIFDQLSVSELPNGPERDAELRQTVAGALPRTQAWLDAPSAEAAARARAAQQAPSVLAPRATGWSWMVSG